MTADLTWEEGTDMLLNVDVFSDMRSIRECPQGIQKCAQCQQRWNRIWEALSDAD